MAKSKRAGKTMAGLTMAAGVVSWNAQAQIPVAVPPPAAVAPLPIPELPGVTALPAVPVAAPPVSLKPVPLPQPPNELLPMPQAEPGAPIPQITGVPPVFGIPQPATPDFNLQPAQPGNTLKDDAVLLRETAPRPEAVGTATTTHPGDSSMPISRSTLFSAALAGALAAGTPVMAQDGGKPPEKIEKATDPKPEDIRKELDEVKKKLDSLTDKHKQLNDTLIGTGDGKAGTGILKKLDDLAESIKTLDSTVKKLDDKMVKLNDEFAKARTVFSSPLKKEEVKVPMGIVKLINDYGDKVTLLVNGTPYRLEPGETKDISVKSGRFEYALPLAGGEIRTSQLKEDEIVTLRIK